MEAKNFGKNLKYFLELLGISQAELAKRTNLTPAAISQIINNKREPNLSSVVAILKIIPVSMTRLLEGDK